MARSRRSTRIGLALCLAAIIVAATGWAWGMAGGEVSTDNAYVRGDVTAISSRVGGYVTAVEVEDNQAVHAGDVLFRIDDRDYRVRVAQAEANVAAAQARLANVDAGTQLQRALIRQAEAQQALAAAELAFAVKASDRHHHLRGSNAVSQAQIDEKDSARDRAAASVDAAVATVEAQKQRITVLAAERDAALASLDQMRAARDLALIDLESTVVRAPVDGVVGNRQVRVGRLVAPGPSVLDLVPVEKLWLVANFKETEIEHIVPGLSVRIDVDGFPDETFEGTVDSFAPGSGAAFSLLPPDNATGNFIRIVQRVPVKIRFVGNLPRGRLVPGLSARVQIDQPHVPAK
ncbi:HlyD family secretion protein [Aurantimonas sp. VKM B-3413]|uniref:HlyD family secretion protein n=1 Tax=Aurantimonas sp. VKM B-3413 TaxID=2779401 RepID=UPI001E521D43|nr:HlyD family secretion protein [Aurantimonas sp. VKM B-3413]MCB8840225.1 HlyD family secretion protein [Aurantimonas sp. VKM B-3413]